MRRLYSTFATGAPGVGLLLLRLVVAAALVCRGIIRLSGDSSIELTVLTVLAIGAGLLLLVGLWTPIAGLLAAMIEGLKIFLLPENLWIYLPLAMLSAALVLLGPGAWSIDARLFGWKRIDIRDRQGRASPHP